MSNKTLDFYRQQPYRRIISRVEETDGSVYFVVTCADLPGFMAHGSSPIEANISADGAFDDYIEARLEWGDPVPTPSVVRSSKRQDLVSSVASWFSTTVSLRSAHEVFSPDSTCLEQSFAKYNELRMEGQGASSDSTSESEASMPELLSA